jgi:hypothetical protein
MEVGDFMPKRVVQGYESRNNRKLPRPKCTSNEAEFCRLGRRVISANFEGGDISTEGL